MIPIDNFLVLATVMFLCGIIGVITRKNLILIMLSIELMLNSANLLFVAGSKMHNNLDGQVMVFFIITVAACEAAVGLAMVISLYRKYGTVDTNFLRMLRG